MSKEKSSKDKKEKKEKKSKHTEDGIKKASKKEKKPKLSSENVAAAYDEVTKTGADGKENIEPMDVDADAVEVKAIALTKANGEVVLKPVGALVPFANPLADDKVAKKVLKGVKKGRISIGTSQFYP